MKGIKFSKFFTSTKLNYFPTDRNVIFICGLLQTAFSVKTRKVVDKCKNNSGRSCSRI